MQAAGLISIVACRMRVAPLTDWLTDLLHLPPLHPPLSLLCFLWLFVVVYVASMLISGILFYGKLIKIARPPQQQQRQQSNIFIYLFSSSYFFSNSFCFSLCCLMANSATWPACGATSAGQQNNKRNSKTIGATRRYLNILTTFNCCGIWATFAAINAHN